MSLWKWLAVSLLIFPAVAEAVTIKLVWDAPLEGMPTGYIMERKRGVNDTWGALPTRPTGLTHTDTFAATEWPVCYRVRAYLGDYQSAPSNEICLTLPASPLNLTGAFEGTFQITFTPVPAQ